jgi:hypothetical protein
MAKGIEKRIEDIEDSLQVKRPPRQLIVILGCRGDKNLIETLGDTEQWASYKQYMELHQDDSRILLSFYLDAELEVKARQRPLTKDELHTMEWDGW